MTTPSTARASDGDCVLAVVQVLGCRVGIDVAHVVLAIPVPSRMASMPRRAGGIVGVIAREGRPVPVVQVERWLEPDDDGAAEVVSSADARVVVLRDRGQEVGLLVEAVVGIQRCDARAVSRLFHDERPDELFQRAALVDPDAAPVVLLEPARLAALAGAWSAAAGLEGGTRSDDATHAAVAPSQARAPVGIFRVGDCLVGIDADDIGELLRVPKLRPPPFHHAAARGLCDWRGGPLAVVDLTAALHAMPDAGTAAWMCVVRRGDLALGVLVHEIVELAALAGVADALAGPGPGLVRSETPTACGIVRIVDSAQLMALFPESSLSARRPVGEAQARRERTTAEAYMVFESDGSFAASIAGVQEVVPLPDSLRPRLEAGLPASLTWRGHVVPVRDVLRGDDSVVVPGQARQLIVVTDGERRIAVPITAVKAMIPTHGATQARMRVGGRTVDVVSAEISGERRSFVLVDLACHVRAAARPLPAA